MEMVKETKSVVKGVKFLRAKPGDILDVYAFYKQALKEGVLDPVPSERQFDDMYWETLNELAMPEVFYILAYRGRACVGMAKVNVIFRKVGPGPIGGISMVYVNPKKRKLGIGRELMKTAISSLKKLGIARFEFHCKDELVEYYQKICGAKKTYNYMVVE